MTTNTMELVGYEYNVTTDSYTCLICNKILSPGSVAKHKTTIACMERAANKCK
jgi:hypothetical protein